MEKVINLLYEIEEKANSVVEEAAGKKAELYENYQKELGSLDEAMEQASKEKLEKLRQKMNEEIGKEHQMLVESLNKELHKLEGNYHKNHDKLVEIMLAKITGA